MKNERHSRIAQALWRIYNRPQRPIPWVDGGNLPWNQEAFSQRMLQEHLDESHGAASRISAERELQLSWLRQKLDLQPGMRILDMTCGPGFYAVDLAKQGCSVVGVDFSPAAIAYARQLAEAEGVADRCTFVEQDVLQMDYDGQGFDAALFIYGQLAVFPRHQAQILLQKIACALRPGGRLCVELLNQERIDKCSSNWWFTDNTGLWGSAPFLHLGERFWLPDQQTSMERFQIIHLETGQMDEITLCDQSYAVETMCEMMKTAGFQTINAYPAWDNLPLYDRDEWIIYIAQTPQ
jgi:ubiquinone/menaquinone biosynthesis C-methylase UbiE